MRKFLQTLVLLFIVCPCILFMGCDCAGGKNAEITRMTVDTNPSVEFMLDKDNKVVSVTALNDDGSVIIYGETFIGKTADEAVELYVNIAYDTGYLVEGENTKNEVKVSFSCDEKQAKQLYENIKNKVETFYQENNIEGKLTESVEATKEQLEQMIKQMYPEYNSQQVSQMTKEEILAKMSESRKETQDLISNALRESYYSAKNYELNLTKNEEIAKVLQDVDSQYSEAVEAYNNALNSLNEAISRVKEAKQTYLLNADSDYQKAVNALLDAKANVLEKEKELAVLKETEPQNAIEEMQLTMKINALDLEIQGLKTILTNLEQGLTFAYNTANTAIDGLISTLTTIQTNMEELKNNLPTDVKSLINQKMSDIENTVNTQKTEFFNNFETEYNTQIENYENKIKEIKERLKAE